MNKRTKIKLTLPKLHKRDSLYICHCCGEKALLTTPPDTCPHCGRRYTDQVTDLDTGTVIGGEPVMRKANRTERAVYMATRNRKKPDLDLKKLVGGNTVVVVMKNEGYE